MTPGGDARPAGPFAGETLLNWLALFVAGNVISSIVLVVSGHANSDTAGIPTWVFAVAAAAMWTTSLWIVRRFVTSRTPTDFRRAVGLVFRRSDAWGIAIGIASQLVLVNAVNWPLSRLFPDAFNFDDVSRRARDLTEASSGAWIVVLFVIVVVGAPLVEEIIYRGMVQTGLVASWGPVLGTTATAVLFAAVHLVPVEFPGLLAFALVLGWTRQQTGQLGLPIVTHVAFNATGLGLALLV